MHGFQKMEGGAVYRTIGAIARGRYGKCAKTVGDRWQNKGVNVGGQLVHFPPADLEVNGIRYWRDATVALFDQVVAILTQRKPLPPELAALVEEWRHRNKHTTA